MTSESNELAFLRYFYEAAYDAMGPAVDDVYDSIKEDWIAVGEVLPEGYERSYEEVSEDEDEDYNEDAEEDDVG